MTTKYNTATPVVSENAPFTQWGRGMDNDPRLSLVVDNPDPKGAPIESIDLDIRTLPDRPDLIARMPDRFRNRMLLEAEAAKVSKHFVDVPTLPDEIGSTDPADWISIPVIRIKGGAR